MPKAAKLNVLPVTAEKSLKTLVENRTAFTLENFELNVFETHRQSALVPLTFNDLVITSMLRGKKVMHLFDEPGFEYLPGETVLVPASITMNIDFPEASEHNPTQCIALAIDSHKIQQTLNLLNEKYPREGNSYWHFHKNNYHFLNNIELAQNINKIVQVCTKDTPCKDVLADIALQELIVNIIQIQNLQSTSAPDNHDKENNALSFITAFIRTHITEEIKPETLSAKAHMSKATFYRSFKREFGISPHEYIMTERIKIAKRALNESKATIKTVCQEAGFTDANYFVRLFKNIEGVTPKQYQRMVHSDGQKVYTA
jgi:AraC-like DNA-binding protein